MATNEEIEKYCRNCESRDFVHGKGLICKRTKDIPAFEGECEYFEKDKELERMAPPKPDDFPTSMTREQLLAQENLRKGILFAVIACLVGAVAWGLVSISLGRQMGAMAIVVGIGVGFAMRQGKGVRPIFGMIAGALALLSCILGDFITIIGLTAKSNAMTYMEVFSNADFKEIQSVMLGNFASMSLVFYAFAVYEGFKFSYRKQKQPQGGKI